MGDFFSPKLPCHTDADNGDNDYNVHNSIKVSPITIASPFLLDHFSILLLLLLMMQNPPGDEAL